MTVSSPLIPVTKPPPESSSPVSASPTFSRSLSRLSFFWFNFGCLIAVCVVLPVCFFPFPFSLLASLGLLSNCILLAVFRPPNHQGVIAGYTFSDSQIMGMMAAWAALLLFLSIAGLRWLLIPVYLVTFAVFYIDNASETREDFGMVKDLFLDEKDSSNAGFLKFLGGAASSASAAAPTVSAKVKEVNNAGVREDASSAAAAAPTVSASV